MSFLDLVNKAGALVAYGLMLILARAVRRKRGLIAFGAWAGQRFCDNSRALYEAAYQSGCYEEIYWFTTSREIEVYLKARRLPVVQKWSLKGIWLALRAEAYVVSNSLSDVNEFCATGALTVNLWHGSPLKLIERDAERHKNQSFKGIKRRLAELKYKLGCFLSPDRDPRWGLVIATAEMFQNRMCSALNVSPADVVVTGYPRNDTLIRARDRLRSKKSETNRRLRVLYAPTFRDANSLSYLYEELDDLTAIASETEISFDIKLHPIYGPDSVSAVSRRFSDDHITIVQSAACSDVAEILAKYDVLITDFSGIAVDFSLLQRPAIIYAPDLEDYANIGRGLYSRTDLELFEKVHQDWTSVVGEVTNLAAEGIKKFDGAESRRRLHRYTDDESSRRVLIEIQKRRKNYD